MKVLSVLLPGEAGGSACFLQPMQQPLPWFLQLEKKLPPVLLIILPTIPIFYFIFIVLFF